MTLADLHARCVLDAPIPTALSESEPAWKWAARYATPVWRRIPPGDPAAMRAAIEAPALVAPIHMIVQGVNRGRFGRVGVPYPQLVELLVAIAEPDVILVDAAGACLALVTEEHDILVLRGARADWP